MKPGDHPEFFSRPPPEGRSRESTIVLDREGRFWHDGVLVAHAGMASAFASWIGLHPENGRYILNNGYDWSYFTVEDVPFFVVAVRGAEPSAASAPELELSDGSREPLDPRKLEFGDSDALYCRVKRDFRAKFTPSAQLALAPLLETDERGELWLRVGAERVPVPG